MAVTFFAMLAAGCSGSSERATEPTSDVRSSAKSTDSAQASPKRVPRGTVRVVPRRSYPPAEKLSAFSAVKITDANYPAGLAVASDGRIFYSELWGGRIRVIRRNGTVDPQPWADVNRIYGIRWTRFYHGGLSGIAFDPEFAKNHFVYVVTQTPNKRNGLPVRTLILRFKEVNGRGVSPGSSSRSRPRSSTTPTASSSAPIGCSTSRQVSLAHPCRRALIRSQTVAERSCA